MSTKMDTKPEVPKGDSPIMSWQEADGRVSALRLREISRMVRNTASLIATQGKIYTVPGPYWAAEFETRTIYWRATSSLPPHDILTHDELLFLTVHEGQHINITGGWETPKDFVRARFHRLVNAGEDIRIERHACKEFPGFAPIRKAMNIKMLRAHEPAMEGYCFMDQVWLNWMRIEMGMEPMGHPACVLFATNSWPKVNRIFNASSTAKMAKMLEPYYRALIGSHDGGEKKKEKGKDVWPAMEPPKADAIPHDVDSYGNDEPSEQQERSEQPSDGGSSSEDGGAGQGAGSGYGKPKGEQKSKGDRSGLGDYTHDEMLDGMKEDATSLDAKRKLEEMRQAAEDARRAARKAADTGGAQNKPSPDSDDVKREHNKAGYGYQGNNQSNDSQGEALWERAKADMRREINSLARKLTSTLRNNAMDDWEPGLKRGQLDTGQAWRSVGGAVDIFRDRTEVGALDYTFGFLVDVSASQRTRQVELLRASVLAVEACDRARLRYFVLPWNQVPQTGKRIRQSLKITKARLGRYIGRPWGNTYEAPALIFAEEEFMAARSGHTVLITITDGATTRPDESKILIQELENMGVRCIAISIACPEPKHYEESYRVEDAAQLVPLLPKIINSAVKKGGK